VETTAVERAIIGRLVGGGSLGFGEAAAVGVGSRGYWETTAAQRAIIGRAFSAWAVKTFPPREFSLR
jgi:hypothetical protein